MIQQSREFTWKLSAILIILIGILVLHMHDGRVLLGVVLVQQQFVRHVGNEIGVDLLEFLFGAEQQEIRTMLQFSIISIRFHSSRYSSDGFQKDSTSAHLRRKNQSEVRTDDVLRQKSLDILIEIRKIQMQYRKCDFLLWEILHRCGLIHHHWVGLNAIIALLVRRIRKLTT